MSAVIPERAAARTRNLAPQSRDSGYARFCGRPGMAVDVSPVPSVDRDHRELRQFDSVDAADVERHHVGAVGPLAAREHIDAAIAAELMLEGALVEQILLQDIAAYAQLKAHGRQEREVQALLGADRAVARGAHGQIGGALESHLAAVAAAGKR